MTTKTKNSRIIQATKEKTFEAFLNPVALEGWLAPNGMKGKVHNLDLKIGGGYTMSLFYEDEESKGKTSGNEDRYTAEFLELKPHDKIVQRIHFHADRKEFAEDMTMEIEFEEAEGDSTEVTIVFKNIPEGINPKDNEVGTAQSLENLARYLEGDKYNKTPDTLEKLT